MPITLQVQDYPILSLKRKQNVGGDLFTFDLLSTLAFFTCLAVIVFLTLCLDKFGSMKTAYSFLAILLDQSTDTEKLRQRWLAGTALVALWIAFCLCFTSMYKSVLISSLTRPAEAPQLDSYADLDWLGTDYSIFVEGPSFISDLVLASVPERHR